MHKLAFILLVVGGLNWLVFALFNWDIGSLVGGMDSSIAKVIYVVVGLAAVYELISHPKNCKHCSMKKMGGEMS